MPHFNLLRLQANSISVCLICLLLFLPEALQGQSIFYQFDVKDTTTFSTTCGTTTGSYWRTINDSCSITFGTDTLPDCEDPVEIPVEITINASGNLECDDRVYIEYKCGSSWIMLDTLFGCNLTSVQTYVYDFSCPTATVFELRVTFVTNDNTEKLDIRDGDITIYNPCEVTTLPIDNISISGNATSRGNLLIGKLINFTLGHTWLEKSNDGLFFLLVSPKKQIKAGNEKEIHIWDFNVTSRTNYYRMGFEDAHGLITYSGVVAVESETPSTTEINFNHFNSTLTITSDKLLEGELQIYQINGRLIASIILDPMLSDRKANISLHKRLTHPGTYIAVLRNNKDIVRHKFIQP